MVGILKLQLLLPGSHSLKDKRACLRRIQAKVSQQFNISVTECGDQEMWQSTVLGFGVVGSNARVIDSVLQKVPAFVNRLNLAVIGRSETEVFHC